MIDRALTEKTDLSSKNNGAGHMRGYRTADLRLCFCISKTSKEKLNRFSHQASQLQKKVWFTGINVPFLISVVRLNASTVPQCKFDLSQLKPLNEPRCERTYLRGFDINQPGINAILIFPITLESEGHALVYLYDEKRLR